MKSSSLIFAALLAGAASLAQAQSNPPVDAPMRDSTSTPQGEEARRIVDPSGKLEAQEKKHAKKPSKRVQSEAHVNPNKGTPMPPAPPNTQNETGNTGSSSNTGVAPQPKPAR